MVYIEKFRPKASLSILLSRKSLTPNNHMLKAIALSEFISWLFLGHSGRNKKKPTRPFSKGFIMTRSALLARHLTIALLLDRYSKIDLEDERIEFLGVLLMASGGLRLLVESKSIDDVLEEFLVMDGTLRYVVEIVRYLVRAEKYPNGQREPAIEDAKAFVKASCDKLNLKHFSPSAISKIWEDFKPAAPYIYALYLEPSFQPAKIASADTAIDWLNSFTSRQTRIDRFLGRAACAMDVLSKVSRNQRVGDLKEVVRTGLSCQAFDSIELEIISSIDRKTPIKSKPYRPKRIAKK